MDDLTKLKIYKKLYQLNSSIVSSMYYKGRTRLEYREHDKEKSDSQFIESIGDKQKWEYHGICSKEDIKMIEFLEYLLNDNIEPK